MKPDNCIPNLRQIIGNCHYTPISEPLVSQNFSSHKPNEQKYHSQNCQNHNDKWILEKTGHICHLIKPLEETGS
jgi:hypothetical protein